MLYSNYLLYLLSVWILLRVIASETKLKAFAFSNELKAISVKHIQIGTQSKRFKHCDKILDYMEVIFTVQNIYIFIYTYVHNA